MGTLAVRQAIRLAADTAFHTEPQYDLCQCTSAWGRTRHAWRRVVLSKKDSGGEMISVGTLGAAMATPWITHQWMPDHLNTTSEKLNSGFTALAVRGGTNMLREFWPDIARVTHLPARWQGRN